jgi:AraC-like DNA-binding protein
MMRKGDRTLADIALACGFADQSHFTRAFAKDEGTTPGRWRRRVEPDSRHASRDRGPVESVVGGGG